MGSDVSASRAHFVPLTPEYSADTSNASTTQPTVTTSTEVQPQQFAGHFVQRHHYHHHHHHHQHQHQPYQRQFGCTSSPSAFVADYETGSGDYQRHPFTYNGNVCHQPRSFACRPRYQGILQHPPPPQTQQQHSHLHQRESIPIQSSSVVRLPEDFFNRPLSVELSQNHHSHHAPHSHPLHHLQPHPHPHLQHHQHHNQQYNNEDYGGFYMVPLNQSTQSCSCSSTSDTPPRSCESCTCSTMTNDTATNEQLQQQTERSSMTIDMHPTSSTNIIFNNQDNTATNDREMAETRIHYDEVASTAFSSNLNEDASNLHHRDEDEVASTTSNSLNTLPTEELDSCRGSPFSLVMPAPPNNHDEVSSASEAEHVQFAHTRTTNTTTTTSAAALKKHKSTTTNVVGSSPTSTSSSQVLSNPSGNGSGNSRSGSVSGSSDVASAEAVAGSTSSSNSRRSYTIDVAECSTPSSSFRRLSDDQPSTSHRVRLRGSHFNGSYWQNVEEQTLDLATVAWNLHKSSTSDQHLDKTHSAQPPRGEGSLNSSSSNRFNSRYARTDDRNRESEEDAEQRRCSKIQRLNSNRSGEVHNNSENLIGPSPAIRLSIQPDRQPNNNTNGSYVITYAGHQPPPPPPPPLPHRRRRLETITSSDQAQNFVVSDQLQSLREINMQPSTSRGRVSGEAVLANSKTKCADTVPKPPAVLTAPDLQLDWLSDATTNTTDGEDDEVVFVHSSREPILSIDLTADDETPLALEMSSATEQAASSTTNTHHHHHSHSHNHNHNAIPPAEANEQQLTATNPPLNPPHAGEDWYSMEPLFMQPAVVLSPRNDTYNLIQGPSSSTLAATEPQRAHQSTAGYSVLPFLSTESSSLGSRLWQDPCLECYMPDQQGESAERTISNRQQQNTNLSISSSAEQQQQSSASLTMAPCHSTTSNPGLARLRSVWRSYLTDIPPSSAAMPTPMVPTATLPSIPSSPPPIFIVNPFAVTEHNTTHYSNTSSMPAVSSLGLVGVINPNPNAPPPTPVYLQPSLQGAQNSRQMNPPPSHLSMSPGSTTPNVNQYHAHPLYHHSHAHTSTRPHENHIISHNHHGHSHSHSIPHSHSLPHTHTHTFRTASNGIGPPPPYLVHQNLWLRQHNVQEIHRRHMTPTPIDLSSNPLNLTSSFRTRFQQLPNVCSCVHGRNGPVSSLDPVSFCFFVFGNFFLLSKMFLLFRSISGVLSV